MTRYVLEVASKLAERRDLEPRIFAGLHVSRQLVDSKLDCSCGIHVPHTKRTFRLRSAINHFGIALAYQVWRPDVVHETYYTATERVPKNIPVVVTVHDMIHELLPEHFPPDSPVREWKRRAIARATAIVCVSETTRRDLERFVATEGKQVRVISHGGNFSPPTPFALAKVQQLVGKDPFILFVGKRNGYKNFEYLLRVYARSAFLKSSFKLVCFGAESFTADEHARISGLLGDQRRVVHISGSDDTLFACYSRAALFVYPSLYEGFGIPILEAYAANCPVVCSDIEVFREVTSDAAAYIDPTDVEQGVTVLDSVLGDRDHQMNLRQLGTQRLLFYSWSKSANAHADFYKQVGGA